MSLKGFDHALHILHLAHLADLGLIELPSAQPRPHARPSTNVCAGSQLPTEIVKILRSAAGPAALL